MKRNSLFGAVAMFVAGAAIGGGAIVSQQAMATNTPATATDSVTIGMVSADGDHVQCTFTGADAAGLIPTEVPAADELPIEVQAGGEQVFGDAVTGQISGFGVVTTDSLPELDGSGDMAAFGVDTATGVMTISGAGEPQPRQGTPEECASLRDGFLSGPPSGGDDRTSVAPGEGLYIQGSTGVAPLGGDSAP